MLPGGMNPRQMKQMMKRMGIRTEEIDAEEVVIKCLDREIVVESPQVMKTTMSGQEMFQISGTITERELEVEITLDEDDVRIVVEQAQVSEDQARKALEESKGDIAGAILSLKG